MFCRYLHAYLPLRKYLACKSAPWSPRESAQFDGFALVPALQQLGSYILSESGEYGIFTLTSVAPLDMRVMLL